MPRDGDRSLTISEETFEVLKERKRDHDTWNEFLRKAARMANPYPDLWAKELDLEERSRSHLEYLKTRKCGPENNVAVEVYWWEYGGQFFIVPPGQLYARADDADAVHESVSFEDVDATPDIKPQRAGERIDD